MIINRNLRPVQVLRYTAGPVAWAAAWAVAVPAAFAITGASWLLVPFAPVGALGAALAIFIAFRNNTAFGRWNEARSAWQGVLVASRAFSRQILAAANNAIETGTDQAVANALTGVQTEMTTIQSRLGGLASGFQSGLAAIDLKTFSRGLHTKLQDVPEVKVAQVDEFLDLVRGPLRQLSQNLENMSPDQLGQALAGGSDLLASVIAGQGFSEMREALLKPFHAVGSAIAGILDHK